MATLAAHMITHPRETLEIQKLLDELDTLALTAYRGGALMIEERVARLRDLLLADDVPCAGRD